MRTRLLFCLVLMPPIAALASPTIAELTELFMPAQFFEPKLSPDGAYLGFMARRGDKYSVGIYSFATRRMNFSGGDDDIRPLNFWWKGPHRLLVRTGSYKGDAHGYTAFDADGKNNEDVWRINDVRGRLFDALPADPRHVLMRTNREVKRVSLDNASEETISGELENVAGWVIDGAGRPRAAMRFDGFYGEAQEWWRPSPAGAWSTRKFTDKDRLFLPMAVEEGERHLIGWEYGPDADLAIARQDLISGEIQPIRPVPGMEPTRMLLLGQTRRPVALEYEQGAVPKLVSLSDSMAPGIDRMQKHFAGYATNIEDAMPDGKNWLLWVGSSCLPGAYILFNHETSEANVLAFSHDKALSEDRLAPAEYFTFPAKDGTRLSARLWRPPHRPNPPLIVYCPDQLPASAVRDEFRPDVQAFVMQGFAVLKVNVRNSWAFGKASRQVPDNKWAGSLQEDLDAAVQLLIGKKLVDPSRVTLFGRDYGGVLALQVALRSSCYSAVATINAPAKMHRYDLLNLSAEWGANPLASKLGGWRNSEKLAKEMSPILAAPNLSIPALYLHDEESIKGRPNEDGREIRAAAKNAKVPAQTGLAFSWSQYPKPPTKFAREAAEISMKITAFFEQSARTRAP